MAKLYGLNNAADFAAKNLITFTSIFARSAGQPLDKTAVWYPQDGVSGYDRAADYAKTDAAYVGQLITVITPASGNVATTAALYVITDETGTLCLIAKEEVLNSEISKLESTIANEIEFHKESKIFTSEADLNYYLSRGTSTTDGVSEYWKENQPKPYAGQIISTVISGQVKTYALALDPNTNNFILKPIGSGIDKYFTSYNAAKEAIQAAGNLEAFNSEYQIGQLICVRENSKVTYYVIQPDSTLSNISPDLSLLLHFTATEEADVGRLEMALAYNNESIVSYKEVEDSEAGMLSFYDNF